MFVERAGESPGLQMIEAPEQTAAGTIRRLWRQRVHPIPAPPPYSWVDNPRIITTALRYRASSTFTAAGTDNTRYGAPRPPVRNRHRAQAVTRQAGNKAARPTVRNRLLSFGLRVPPENPPSPDAVTR